MNSTSLIDQFKIQQWIVENRSLEYVENALKEMDIDTFEAYVEAFKKAKRSKRITTGFVIMVAGAFLGFIGFILTVTNIFPGMFYVTLFGFTTVSAVLVGWGLYLVLE
jgi:multidrug transporter EmrE-like cation transporter